MKKIINFIKIIYSKTMDFLDFFGKGLFGRDDDDDFRAFQAKMIKLINEMKGKDISPEMLDEYFNSQSFDNNLGINLDDILNENYEQEPPQEWVEISNQIAEWHEEGISSEELDERIVNRIGEPISVRIVEKDDGVFEEYTWNVGSGLLSRLKELTEEETLNFRRKKLLEEQRIAKLRKFYGNKDESNIEDIEPMTIEDEIEDLKEKR
jgi:hypothetical protein